MGCFVYLYAHLFVWRLLEERHYTVQTLVSHMTLHKSFKLSRLFICLVWGVKVIIGFLESLKLESCTFHWSHNRAVQ